MRALGLSLLLLLPLLSGCVATELEGDPGPAAPPPARLEGDPRLEGGELVSREEAEATLEWAGVMMPVASGAGVTQDPSQRTTLSLPASAPLRIEATLEWAGRAALGVELRDAIGERCEARGGSASAAASAKSISCVVSWVEPSDEPHAWSVEAFPVQGLAEPTPFLLTLRVTALVEPARYDITKGPGAGGTAPDPSVLGPLGVASEDYDFGAMEAVDPATRRPYAVRVLGTVHFPTEGEGPFPVVVFLHGRHQFCEGAPGSFVFGLTNVPHCRGPDPVDGSVPSHRGYDDAAALLVSHGYVVVTIDANDINAQDSPRYAGTAGPPRGDDGIEARARLILRTLDEFRAVHEGPGALVHRDLAPLVGRLDLANIGLMGHSRGAEGVTLTPAIAEASGHWSLPSIRAVYSLAGVPRWGLPGFQESIMPAHTAYASVLPSCDGDVWGLQNAEFLDTFAARADRGPLVQLLFMGANHNYYNSEWPQDDAAFRWWNDPYCGPDVNENGLGYGRLSMEDQARHQRVYLPAFFRAFLGGEAALLPLFTGEAAPPVSACPERVAACPRLVHATWLPPADAMRRLEGDATFLGVDEATACIPRAESAPCAMEGAVGVAVRHEFSWSRDASWRTSFAGEGLRGFDLISFRVALDPTVTPHEPRVTLVVEDARGRAASVRVADHSGALFLSPGIEAAQPVLHQVRVPLAAFEGVDIASVRAVEVRFDGATPGRAHVEGLAAMSTDWTPQQPNAQSVSRSR